MQRRSIIIAGLLATLAGCKPPSSAPKNAGPKAPTASMDSAKAGQPTEAELEEARRLIREMPLTPPPPAVKPEGLRLVEAKLDSHTRGTYQGPRVQVVWQDSEARPDELRYRACHAETGLCHDGIIEDQENGMIHGLAPGTNRLELTLCATAAGEPVCGTPHPLLYDQPVNPPGVERTMQAALALEAKLGDLGSQSYAAMEAYQAATGLALTGEPEESLDRLVLSRLNEGEAAMRGSMRSQAFRKWLEDGEGDKGLALDVPADVPTDGPTAVPAAAAEKSSRMAVPGRVILGAMLGATIGFVIGWYAWDKFHTRDVWIDAYAAKAEATARARVEADYRRGLRENNLLQSDGKIKKKLSRKQRAALKKLQQARAAALQAAPFDARASANRAYNKLGFLGDLWATARGRTVLTVLFGIAGGVFGYFVFLAESKEPRHVLGAELRRISDAALPLIERLTTLDTLLEAPP